MLPLHLATDVKLAHEQHAPSSNVGKDSLTNEIDDTFKHSLQLISRKKEVKITVITIILKLGDVNGSIK